jgi:hypothetical protein
MMESRRAPVWRFRLMLVSALGVLVLLVIWLRSRADITRVERQRTAMVAALRTLVAAQDAEQARTGRYAVSLDSLPGYSRPPGLVLHFTALDVTAWGATVQDTTLELAPTTCGVFLGRSAASPHRAVLEPGSPRCW